MSNYGTMSAKFFNGWAESEGFKQLKLNIIDTVKDTANLGFYTVPFSKKITELLSLKENSEVKEKLFSELANLGYTLTETDSDIIISWLKPVEKIPNEESTVEIEKLEAVTV